MTGTIAASAQRKKQLGQYFTDQRIGRLLAALSRANTATTIIDPMVGSADLLQACLSLGAQPEKLVGIELDPLALDRARAALAHVPRSELILGDAFAITLPAEQFDLVITNPPYIRYQSRGLVDGINVPTSAKVRAGVVEAILQRSGLSADARELWLRAARKYPGTSDIAVPAWILSAALVREGGILAVVAPQAWLSRNYAHAVRDLLDSAFHIEFIVEDGDAAWFNDAQIRTQLVVARRRALEAHEPTQKTVIARATRSLATDGSLRGALHSEEAVAAALRDVSSKRPTIVTTGLTAYAVRGLTVAESVDTAKIPMRVATILGPNLNDRAVRTLESYGWRAGQGLRTGANDFFYVEVSNGGVRPATRWGINSMPIPPDCLIPAVRRQSDLGESLVVDDSSLPSRLVNLDGWVTAADSMRMGPGDVQVLPAAVNRWIAQVAETPLSAQNPTKLFPNLAAVVTNAKADHLGRPVRFWYQLPPLAPRHRPSLLVGRVCGGRPKVFLNPSRVVIDANFSGLWPVQSDAMPPEAMLALMSSSWVWVNLESTCTVLGGGALKVEATDLRRLALPDLASDEVARLVQLGKAMTQGHSDTLAQSIDDVIAGYQSRAYSPSLRSTEIRTMAERALRHRSRRRPSR